MRRPKAAGWKAGTGRVCAGARSDSQPAACSSAERTSMLRWWLV